MGDESLMDDGWPIGSECPSGGRTERGIGRDG